MNGSAAAGVVDDDRCFACGSGNGAGLGLRFERDPGGAARARVTLDARYQGYRGIAHGGIVMLLLDEVMAHAAGAAGEKVMSAAVAVRFRAPVPLETPLEVTGHVVSQRGKVLKIEAAVRTMAGAILASGEGSFVSLGRLAHEPAGNSAVGDAV